MFLVMWEVIRHPSYMTPLWSGRERSVFW